MVATTKPLDTSTPGGMLYNSAQAGLQQTGTTPWRGEQWWRTGGREAAQQGGAMSSELGSMLMQRANGTGGPSVAEAMYKGAMDRNVDGLSAALGAQRGGNPGAAASTMADQYAQNQAATAQGLAQMRAQEQIAAQQQAGALSQSLMGQGLGVGGQMQSGALNAYGVNAGMMNNGANLMQAAEENKARELQAFLGMGLQGGAAAASTIPMFMSDERLKEDVEDGDSETKSMLDALSAKSWKYKNERHGEGRFLGFIAQDLEKSDAGKRMIVETKHGKGIDGKKAVMAALASVAHLNKRLAKIGA